MKALISEAVNQGLVLKDVPKPRAISGTLVVKVLASLIEPDASFFLTDKSPFQCPRPFTPGGLIIGRVEELPPDATALSLGQLLLVDSFILARDNPSIQLLWGLWGGPSPTSQSFMANNYRHAGFAEFALVPLENAHPLNEHRLCTELGYTIPELLYLHMQLVTYGGFRGINLQAGEQVIIAPATGEYSGAAVGVAVAMGARVVAVGRKVSVLKQLQARFSSVEIVQVTGDVEADTAFLKQFGEVDAYLDISPVQAGESTHLTSCFGALRSGGRASLMGVVGSDLKVPYVMLMGKGITVKGQFMYERKDVVSLIKLAESGVLKLGKEIGSEIVGSFKLHEYEEGLKTAQENHAVGKLTVFEP